MSNPPPPGPPGPYPQGPPGAGGAYQPGVAAPGGYPQGPPSGGYPAGPPSGGYPAGPPSGGYPPQGPPTGGYPPGYGGPPPKQSKTGLIVGLSLGVLIVLVVVVVAVVVATRGPSSISEEEASASLQTILDEADFDTDAELEECPLGDLGDYEVVVEDEVADVPRLRDSSAGALEEFDGSDPGVACIATEDEDEASGAGIYAYTAEATSGDRSGGIEDLFEDDDVTVEEAEGFRGGDLYPYCVEPGEDSEAEPGCGADWVGDEIVVGMYLEGIDADAEISADVLRDVLPDMVDALAVAEPDFTE